MLRAIIFDFDGIIIDSEPVIFKLTQDLAALEGWAVSEDEYYRDYLALDDRGIVEHLFTTHDRPLNSARRDELIQWKARAYEKIIRNGLPAMPGAIDFVQQVAAQYPLAIASGSMRNEIEHLLEKIGLRQRFAALATADDCARSKPDPAVFIMALSKLQQLPVFEGTGLRASECLAIEDAPLGVNAAHAAGLRCLALSHSRPLEELQHADWTWREFSEVDLDKIRRSFL